MNFNMHGLKTHPADNIGLVADVQSQLALYLWLVTLFA